MGQHFHVHDESESASGGDHLHRWDAARMARHLKNVHGFVAPMAWDLGRLHLHHLEDHQGPGPKTMQPEEAPVPIEHIHDDLTTVHASWSHAMLARHLRDEHDQDIPDVNATDHDDLKRLHLAQHPEGALADEDPDEVAARHLWMEDTDSRVPGNWDDLLPETKTYWRNQLKLRREKSQVSAVSTGPSEAKDSTKTQGERIIEVDRIICAMAGIDFDRDWAADSGLGPHGRGALRAPYAEPAKRLLTWLERGGALHLAPVASMASDLDQERQLVHDLEETNNRLRGNIAGLEQSLEARNAQLEHERGIVTEQQDRLEEVRQQLTNLQDRADELEEERDRAQQALMAKLTEAGELRGQLDNVITQRDNMASELIAAEQARDHYSEGHTAGLELQQQLQAANTRQAAVIHERERQLRSVNQQADALLAERDRLSGQLAESRRALAEGRSALRNFIREFRKEDWSGQSDSPWVLQRPEKIALSLEEAVLGERVSTEETGSITCTEPHLGLATTGEMLDEVRTRIDLGHCGLDYRTVDGDL